MDSPVTVAVDVRLRKVRELAPDEAMAANQGWYDHATVGANLGPGGQRPANRLHDRVQGVQDRRLRETAVHGVLRRVQGSETVSNHGSQGTHRPFPHNQPRGRIDLPEGSRRSLDLPGEYANVDHATA
jgi:hypothetical protein